MLASNCTKFGKARAQARVRELAPVIQELRDAGHITARAIADGLNMRGWPTPQGKDRTRGNVHNLLKQVAAFDDAQERSDSLKNENWGTWRWTAASRTSKS